jgi:hypothetical protein
MTLHAFSTATLDAPAVFSLAGLDTSREIEGNVVKGLKVFRIGTFTDSLGRTRSWTQEELDLCVRNWSLLRGNKSVNKKGETVFDGAVPWVPIRADHSKTVKDLVGWYSNVYTDPTEPGFLLADIEFTEPDALGKYQRGTFRNRSIEIGRYTDNEGNVHEPVVLGLAFCDLPAVEGLFRTGQTGQAGDKSPAGHSQGATMTPEEIKKLQDDLAAATTAQAAADAAKATAEATLATITTERDTLQAAVIERDNQLVTARQAAGQTFTFSVGGQTTQDFAAVQAHVAALETFRTDITKLGRETFVDDLASTNKIANTQKDDLKKFALSLSPEQFETWKSGYAAAPALGMFSSLPLTNGAPPPGPGNEADAKATAIKTCQDIVAAHRAGGMAETDVIKTASYTRLQELTKA